jgi:tetratricopeptide (TPR) repeat protein
MTLRVPPPTARGNLAKTPFLHLVVYMADKGFAGTIAFGPAGSVHERFVHFERGAIVKIRAAASDGDGSGSPMRILSTLLHAPGETGYRYYADLDLFPEEPQRPALDPIRIIGSAISSTATTRIPDVIVEGVLEKVGTRVLKMHPQGDVDRFGFGATELAIVQRIRATPSTLAALVGSGVAPERTVRLVVYVLLITRRLDQGSGAAPICPRWRSDPPPQNGAASSPSSGLAELVMRRDAILERASLIDREDYFAILGVPRDVKDAELQSAYFALAKTWHTDRLPAALSEVRETATRVFARMTEAFETLSDPERRAQYVTTLVSPSGKSRVVPDDEAERIQSVLEAASNFRKAEILLKKNDLAAAEKLARAAREADPDQADYIALHVSIIALGRADPTADVSDLITELSAALLQDARNERAYFTRATLHRRAGRFDLAIADFRKVAEINPKNVDAVREVRLYEMRRQSGTAMPAVVPGKAPAPADKSQGPVRAGLGKLFKR